ncbi:MAG: twin-arginine translocase TatA/TatE family subunit [Deltaproteobacteria bacterium]|nr:twin-arginine translocase TatA/TatE family subunit [Deltaproteobacteria bacterium]
MFGLGFGELIIILLIILVLFGGSKLPLLGEAIAKSIVNFKKAIKQDNNSSQNNSNDTDKK